MAENSGFFNALRSASGQYDIKYNADHYSKNMAAIISNGVRRSGDDDLRVLSAGGFALKVKPGFGWINGRWYQNDSEFTSFSVPTPPVGDRSRIDRIVLRLNTAIDGREIRLAYLQGTPDTAPQAPALTRSGSVYELAIADITVPAAASSITDANIVDQRPNGAKRDEKIGEDEDGNPIWKTVAGEDLCGWITSPVGYEGFFTSLDASFESWFKGVRERVATVTMPRFYRQRITVESAGKVFTFSIA